MGRPAGFLYSEPVMGLKVAALMSGEPGPLELWTLRNMASAACEVSVLQAAPAAAARTRGLVSALSRAIGSRIAALDREILKELFDFDDLHEWWTMSGIPRVGVPSLDHAQARTALASLAPDVIVRLSESGPAAPLHEFARIAALNVHHAHGGIPWGLAEGKRDWIGAAIQVDGPGQRGVLWRGAPQLAPGDTNVDLLFRAHLEAAQALAKILRAYASGAFPAPVPASGDVAAFGSASGLAAWIKFLRLDRGRRARVLIERALEC